MCGIVGVASIHPVGERAWLAVGRDAMFHRGPDDAGEWWSDDGRVGLGHRRLSILDLSPLGHQPMREEERGLSVVFNGEIYNHRELRKELILQGYVFRSHSDTEVVLASYAAWGENCLAYLNGMFAIAIYDSLKHKLFIARDRAGEKPLFYRLTLGTIQFASELKALFANTGAPRRIDSMALDCFLAMGFVPGELCILQGYNKLPPAHALSFDLHTGRVRTWQYWTLPELSTNIAAGVVDENVLLDELEVLLEDAVGRQLIADVPVGILLSGGVDSSLVTALAVRRSSEVRTFSIGFPGHGKLDETPHARLIARYFGTEHTELMAEPATAELIPRLSVQFDEPMADSSMIPTYIVSELVRHYCTVALSGDGGDELFAGYPHYSRLLWMQRWLMPMPRWLRHGMANMAKWGLPEGMKGRMYLQGLDIDLNSDLPLLSGFFDKVTRSRLIFSNPDSAHAAESLYKDRIPHQIDLLQRSTRMDFSGYLAEDILVKVDRASMLHSLEVRAPFLDVKLVEFAYSRVPSYLKATVGDKKILLKRLAARLLPRKFDLVRKQGFSIPLAQWLKGGPFRDLFWDILSSPDCLFDRHAVQHILKGQDRGYNNTERLFALVQFELWRRHYGAVL